MCRMTLCSLVLVLACLASAAPAADGNRLAHLDEFSDPYYVGLTTPKLVVPQWVGQPGVEAVIVLAIDDMSKVEPYEKHLRPILERLKKIDGRAPVSIMTDVIDPNDPQLQAWLREGLSIETHTRVHACPCLQNRDLAAAKASFDECVDLLATIANNRPVGFRMPCCDSMSSVSPRFFTEVFNKTTPGGRFLSIDASVFNLFTPRDSALPRGLVLDADGREKFGKYVATERGDVNVIEDYPYPYVIARLCWEIPCLMPSDWAGQNRNKPDSPVTLADWKAAVDLAVLKRGALALCFHPHAWMRNDMVAELVDYAATQHAGKVKFLTLREVDELLRRNVLGGQPLRAPGGRDNGQDNGARVLDLNGDGYMDAVVANEQVRQTRVWSPESGTWTVTDFPVPLVSVDAQGNRRETGVRFGVLGPNGMAGALVRNESFSGMWHFDGKGWTPDPKGLVGLELDGPILTSAGGRDRGVRLHDLDGDGLSELIVGNERQCGVFRLAADGWTKLPFALPPGTGIVDDGGRDAGLRFADIDGDGRDDLVFSNAQRYSLHLFQSMAGGWSRRVAAAERNAGEAIPMIVRADGTNNGAWFHGGHMWVQNEETGANLPNHIFGRPYTQLLTGDVTPAK